MQDTQRDLELAATEIERMADATRFSELRSFWETFLFRLERAWERTERVVHGVSGGEAQSWLSATSKLRRTDPLLQYLKQARNTETHALGISVDTNSVVSIADRFGRPFNIRNVKISIENKVLTVDLESHDIGIDWTGKIVPGALPISTSKRFGPAIAAAVSSVQVGGKPVIGAAADVHQPTLMTYTTERVGDVLNHFGQLVLDRFKDEQLHRRPIKALCTRKQGNAQTQIAGRTLLDYWPAYLEQARGTGGRSERLWSLLNHPAHPLVGGISMQSRAADAKRAVLLVLRAGGSPHIAGLRDGSQLFRRLADAGQDVRSVRQLCRKLAIAPNLGATDDGRVQVVDLFTQYLHPLMSAGMSVVKFQALPVFNAPEKLPQEEENQRLCRVTRGDRVVEVEIGTVASMKGETHVATLVLESLGHPSRRFDLEEALPVLAGVKVRDPGMKETILSQFRNLYVGMSRPTSFLCLAVNRTRVSTECITALQKQGWVVEVLA